MELFLNQIKNVVETHPDFIEGDFEVKDNKGFRTLYFCDIAVIKVVPLKNENRIEVAKKYYSVFGLDQNAYESDTKVGWIKVALDDQIVDIIHIHANDVFKKCYKDSAEFTFGCCSRFIECSDAKKCTCKKEYYFNNIKRFPSGCMYKDNLDQGLIFYGKNKNYPHTNKNS